MIFFDTESLGATGPLITIQLASLVQLQSDEKYCYYHKIWEEPLIVTIRLLEKLCTWEEGICGFNLVHDWFQINKWYNVFRQLTEEELNNESPRTLEARIAEIEARGPTAEDRCLKPQKACDLMLLARAGKYQYLAKHKSIVLRKVPIQITESNNESTCTGLFKSLSERIWLPRGIKIRWRISQKKTGRKDVVDVLGDLFPSSAFLDENSNELKPGMATKKQTFASLKQLAALILNDPSIAEKTFEQEVLHGQKLLYKEQPDYKPWGGGINGGWTYGLRRLCDSLYSDGAAIAYARNDIFYTYKLWQDLESPCAGDDDSELACLVGASYWKGFAIAPVDKLALQISKYNKIIGEMESANINCNSPNSVLRYLHSFCSDIDRLSIQDTKRITLEAIERGEEWTGHPLQEAVRKVQETRKAYKRKHLLECLISAGRFCFAMKIQGTLSSRMAGGAERELKSSGKAEKLNPQGIPRETDFRSLFKLAFPDENLEGGDFEAFEPTILDAICGDEQFRKDLKSGLKIHLFAGSEFYGISPEDILATKGTTSDKYIRSKNGFLGWIYGAQQRRVAQVLDIDEAKVEQGYGRIARRYPKITEHRTLLRNKFIPLRQEGGAGTAIEWVEPDEKITAIKLPWQSEGYSRTFTIEWAVIRGLFALANEPPDEWIKIPGQCRRTNRVQSIVGAMQSALYASIFALQEHVFRAAANHEIQCPGAQITKHLQRKIWDLQPSGIGPWKVRPFNSHDEVQVPCSVAQTVETTSGSLGELPPIPGNVGVVDIKTVVLQVVKELQQTIPLLKITWQTGLNNWGEKS